MTEDRALLAAYRAESDDLPAPDVDDALRAAARRAVGARPRAKGRGPFAGEWRMPLAAAATVVLSATVVFLTLRDHGLDELARPSAPAASAPTKADVSVTDRRTVADDARGAPQTTSPVTQKEADRDGQRLRQSAAPDPAASPDLSPNASPNASSITSSITSPKPPQVPSPTSSPGPTSLAAPAPSATGPAAPSSSPAPARDVASARAVLPMEKRGAPEGGTLAPPAPSPRAKAPSSLTAPAAAVQAPSPASPAGRSVMPRAERAQPEAFQSDRSAPESARAADRGAGTPARNAMSPAEPALPSGAVPVLPGPALEEEESVPLPAAARHEPDGGNAAARTDALSGVAGERKGKGLGKAGSSDTAAAADAAAAQDGPEARVGLIRRLLREGRRDEALRHLAALRSAYPDYALPPDLGAWVKELPPR